jgi:hypothetical protein
MTTARKTKEKMVGDRNRPLGLILEWKMMILQMGQDQRDRLKYYWSTLEQFYGLLWKNNKLTDSFIY